MFGDVLVAVAVVVCLSSLLSSIFYGISLVVEINEFMEIIFSRARISAIFPKVMGDHIRVCMSFTRTAIKNSPKERDIKLIFDDQRINALVFFHRRL